MPMQLQSSGQDYANDQAADMRPVADAGIAVDQLFETTAEVLQEKESQRQQRVDPELEIDQAQQRYGDD